MLLVQSVMPSSTDLSLVTKFVEKHCLVFYSHFSDIGSLSINPSLSKFGLCKCRRKDSLVPVLGGCILAQR